MNQEKGPAEEIITPKRKRYYTGIGSRETPKPILELMERVAGLLAREGCILRSGHASGADQAFERGAGGKAEIYLPWAEFESRVPVLGDYIQDKPTLEAAEFSSKYHPAWEKLGRGSRHLHARNAHQIFGRDVMIRSVPSGFVICWTKDGTRDGSTRGCGGTGQALRIAAAHQIPVYNLANGEDYNKITEWQMISELQEL